MPTCYLQILDQTLVGKFSKGFMAVHPSISFVWARVVMPDCLIYSFWTSTVSHFGNFHALLSCLSDLVEDTACSLLQFSYLLPDIQVWGLLSSAPLKKVPLPLTFWATPVVCRVFLHNLWVHWTRFCVSHAPRSFDSLHTSSCDVQRAVKLLHLLPSLFHMLSPVLCFLEDSSYKQSFFHCFPSSSPNRTKLHQSLYVCLCACGCLFIHMKRELYTRGT